MKQRRSGKLWKIGLTARSSIAFVVLVFVVCFTLKAFAPPPVTSAEDAALSDEAALHWADNNFEQGEYKDAIALFERLATKGNAVWLHQEHLQQDYRTPVGGYLSAYEQARRMGSAWKDGLG